MESVKKLFKRILYPHHIFLIILTPIAICFLILATVLIKNRGIVNYISYLVAAYTLTAVCLRIPIIIVFVIRIKEENALVNRLFNDAHLRITISLYGSLAFNITYGIFQLCLGFYHGSIWFYSLAAYHIILAVVRFCLLNYTRTNLPGKDRKAEYIRYRLCGVSLLLMNLALSVIIFFITWQNRTFVHHSITTIAMATFTFTLLTVAIVNVFRYKKFHSPVYSASKVLNLASALVSLLTLETTMLTAFGDESTDSFRQVMTGATGGAISVIILGIAGYMITRSTIKLKKLSDMNQT